MPPEASYPTDSSPYCAASHSRIAGLEQLPSPTLRSKILPWLGGVRTDDNSSTHGQSESNMGQQQSSGGAGKSSRLKKTPTRPTRASSPTIQAIIVPSDAFYPHALGSPIKFSSAPRTPARNVSDSTGARQDRGLYGEGTVPRDSSPPTTPPATAPNQYPLSPSICRSEANKDEPSPSCTSGTTDTSFGNPYRSSPTSHPLPHAQPIESTAPVAEHDDVRPHTNSTLARETFFGRAFEEKKQASSVPISMWGPKPASKTSQANEAAQKEFSAHDRHLSPPFPRTPVNGTSPPHPTSPVHARRPLAAGKYDSASTLKQPSHLSADPLATHPLDERTPVDSPQGETTRPGRAFKWSASMFQDRVLCELLEFVGKPGLEETTRTLLMDLLAKRLSELQVSELSETAEKMATPSWAADLQKEIALLRKELLERDVPIAKPATSTAPTEADSFFKLNGSGGLLLQQLHDAEPFAFVPQPDGLHPFASLPQQPRSPISQRFKELSSTDFGTAPNSLKIDVHTSSIPKVSHSQPKRASVPSLSVEQRSIDKVEEGDNDNLKTAHPSPSNTPPVSPLPLPQASVHPARQPQDALHDLVQRSLPPTPPSEAALLVERGPVLPLTPPAVDDNLPEVHPRPPTVASILPEDPLLPRLPNPRPWDLVTQRLYAWAILWQEESFAQTLEDISLDKQVNAFALTIWTTVTYKRQLRNKLSNDPHGVVDKAFVPPSFGDLLNKACHHKNYKDAKEILLGLWRPFHLDRLSGTGFPRIIVALTKHRNEDDAWSLHRFDLASSTMSTWLFFAGEARLKDERPVGWWLAIREAWPEAHVKHPNNIHHKVQHVVLPAEDAHNASLHAVNCWRSVLMGWSPDRATDLARLRELIWAEVRRLQKRKADDTLVFDLAGDAGRADDF